MLFGLILIGTAYIFLVVILGFLYFRNVRLQNDIKERRKHIERRMYELAILKQLGERVGYSLDVHQIADVIIGSLHQFIDYSAASYMLIDPEQVLFKVHLEKSVSRSFVDDVQRRMTNSLSALLDADFSDARIEEVLSGAVLIDDIDAPVRSFFNIPLVIEEKVVGVLTVADTKEGLYREEDMTILYKITNQASQAVTRLQSVVHAEQRKLNAMVESMEDGVLMTDKDYRIVVANPSARRLVELDENEEATIFDFIDVFGGTFDIRGRLEESVRKGKQFMSDRILVNDTFLQVLVMPVTTHLGEVLGGVVIFHDITREMEVERLRDEFTSMLVHELRSPLGGIRQIAEVLSKGKVKSGTKSYENYIELISKSTDDMLLLVNDVLDVAKLESGKFDIHKESGSLETLLKERVAFFEPTAKKENITLENVVSLTEEDTLLFDHMRIAQVLNNLISNAMKFTQSGGHVTVVAWKHERNADISQELKVCNVSVPFDTVGTKLTSIPAGIAVAVIDNGVGISKSGQEKLFSKFTQLHDIKSSKGHKGTGLGLVIVKGIVEAHHGTMYAASEEGAGTMMLFTLPQK